jgi:hypothetical protein
VRGCWVGPCQGRPDAPGLSPGARRHWHGASAPCRQVTC